MAPAFSGGRAQRSHLPRPIGLMVLTLGIGFSSLGCATVKVAPNPAALGVSFDWTRENVCTNQSPEIRVAGIPPATAELRVTLQDLDLTTYNHGGGAVGHDGSGIIQAGALRNYRGPCPPGLPHQYRITVRAVDPAGVIVGVGAATRPCCEGL